MGDGGRISVRQRPGKAGNGRNLCRKPPEYQVNVEYLKRVQPKDLNASEIEVRLGANWIKAEYITDFMERVFKTPSYYIGSSIKATYSEISGAWNISGKSLDRSNPRVTNTYGTMRVNGYRLLEDALNLRDTKIYDTIYEDGKERRVLNKKKPCWRSRHRKRFGMRSSSGFSRI